VFIIILKRLARNTETAMTNHFKKTLHRDRRFGSRSFVHARKININMSFRKRTIGASRIADTSTSTSDSSAPGDVDTVPAVAASNTLSSGVRPSPVDGRLTTSTGTPTLDTLLAGHAGLPLGSSILLEENGTTDYAGSLLKYYAAEGIVQGHVLHVVGVREGWTRELPGLVGGTDNKAESSSAKQENERMKIAWRYENLGRFGEGPGARGVYILSLFVENINVTIKYRLPSKRSINSLYARS